MARKNHMLKKSLLHTLLLAIVMLALPAISSAGIIFSIGIAPPPLPVYEQPVCPGDGYIWTPGYWAYDDVDGYFWVPGTWVLIPEPGFLWTPGYWGWENAAFIFHEGYWGPHIGFYGGINYGFGYIGVGYEGGYWNNGAFFYNRAFNHIDHVTNVYNKTVVVNTTYVSYNGGAGGINARPTAEEEAAARDRHVAPTSVQVQHRQIASTNRQLFESVNHGKPPIAATARPGEFSGHGVVGAKSAAKNYQPPTARGGTAPARGNPAEAAHGNTTERSASPVHPNDLPKMERPGPVNSGNPKQDQKYQQQQQKLFAKQDQERQKLQQKQEQEHQQIARSKPNPQKQQQMEQRHQQQTQQLQQRHTTQMQNLQSRQPQPRSAPRK
jgi:hypothetical protein